MEKFLLLLMIPSHHLRCDFKISWSLTKVCNGLNLKCNDFLDEKKLDILKGCEFFSLEGDPNFALNLQAAPPTWCQVRA